MAVQQRIAVDNEISGSRSSVGRHPIVLLICVTLCVPIAATTVTTMSTPSPSTDATTSRNIFSESVVIPGADPEREAKELYDKALQQFNVGTGRTLRAICASWDGRGCQCSGSTDEVVLMCKGLELEEVPVDLPIELIKL
ncbi:Leucine-rich repeat [Sergentomyia squamirostris]